MLIVIAENDDSKILNDLSCFISENLDINHPNFFLLYAYTDSHFKATIDAENLENISDLIRDVWDGRLRFCGPLVGIQPVNLEFVQDECWKCKCKMKTVTGIVFPNMQLKSWDNAEWQYYHNHLKLSNVKDKNGNLIKEFISKIRTNNPQITPVDFRLSQTTKTKYWAAGCPECGALRGDFHVNSHRMQYLHNFESRLNHKIEYLSIELDVD